MELYRGAYCISGTELIRSDENPDGLVLKNTYQSLVSRRRINIIRRGNLSSE